MLEDQNDEAKLEPRPREVDRTGSNRQGIPTTMQSDDDLAPEQEDTVPRVDFAR